MRGEALMGSLRRGWKPRPFKTTAVIASAESAAPPKIWICDVREARWRPLRLRSGQALGYLMPRLRGWIVVAQANSRFLPFALRMVGMTRLWTGLAARLEAASFPSALVALGERPQGLKPVF